MAIWRVTSWARGGPLVIQTQPVVDRCPAEQRQLLGNVVCTIAGLGAGSNITSATSDATNQPSCAGGAVGIALNDVFFATLVVSICSYGRGRKQALPLDGNDR